MSKHKSDLSGTTTIVVGASRGLGRGITTALAAAGARFITGYAQDEAKRAGLDITFTPEIAGTALVELVRADAASVAPGYRLSGAGPETLP